MLTVDFSDRTYTAEVMKTKGSADHAFLAIQKLACMPKIEEWQEDGSERKVRICHAFLASKREHHRFPRKVIEPDGTEITIPRTDLIKGQQCFLYDVFVAQCQNHLVVAVPFHELAEEFFVRVDRALAGTQTRYEKLDITKLVIMLGSAGSTSITEKSGSTKLALSVTRCHLSYVNQNNRNSNLQQIRMTGSNLGASKEYKSLLSPVLEGDVDLVVTPIVLGFALLENGVRRSSATTDRHGNFKLWIAPGLRQLVRLFNLLRTIDSMKNVVLTTPNVPILQSKTIRDAED